MIRVRLIPESTAISEPENLPAQGNESLSQGIQSFSSSIESEFHRPLLSGPDLADTFLAVISGPFGDQNPKGTRTRIRTLLHEANLSDATETVRCLVRAYLVARNTRTIRAEHIHPQTGQVNRMPLFCAMVQRFVEQRQQGTGWEDSWRHLEEEIAADVCLAPWWSEHKSQISIPSETLSDGLGAEQQQGEESEATERSDQENAAFSVRRSPRRRRLSQTDAQREERAALAHRVLWRLVHRGLPIQEACVLWEHQKCGCPLYHRLKGREVCALCFPDPDWPEEAMALLRSIVEGEPGCGEAPTGVSRALARSNRF